MPDWDRAQCTEGGSAERGSLRRADQVERAWHLRKLGGRQVEILGRRFQVRVAEQELDRTHVGTGFEQVGSEAVSERVWRDALFDPRLAGCFCEHTVNRFATESV